MQALEQASDVELVRLVLEGLGEIRHRIEELTTDEMERVSYFEAFFVYLHLAYGEAGHV